MFDFTIYEVTYTVFDYERCTRSVTANRFASLDNALYMAREVATCGDIDDGIVNVIDGLTGEVMATYLYGELTYRAN